MRKPRFWAMCVVSGLALALSLTSTARAGVRSPYLMAYYGYHSPSIYSLEQPPYFALHPPVYYSYPVARPYGFSPYPCPAGVMPAEFASPRPSWSVRSRKRPIETRSGERPPLRILNPFVVKPDDPAAAEGTFPSPKPQVIRPAEGDDSAR